MSCTETHLLSVKLYLKAGCHLCEQAEATLDDLRSRYAHTLERIDINTEPDLLRRYAELIPVLVVAGREYPAPLSRATIEQALARATQLDGDSRVTPDGDSRTSPAADCQQATQDASANASKPGARRYPCSQWHGR